MAPPTHQQPSAFTTASQPLPRRGNQASFPDAFQALLLTTTPALVTALQAGAMLRINVVIDGNLAGSAQVPLAPLLTETWVQGLAKLWGVLSLCMYHSAARCEMYLAWVAWARYAAFHRVSCSMHGCPV